MLTFIKLLDLIESDKEFLTEEIESKKENVKFYKRFSDTNRKRMKKNNKTSPKDIIDNIDAIDKRELLALMILAGSDNQRYIKIKQIINSLKITDKNFDIESFFTKVIFQMETIEEQNQYENIIKLLSQENTTTPEEFANIPKTYSQGMIIGYAKHHGISPDDMIEFIKLYQTNSLTVKCAFMIIRSIINVKAAHQIIYQESSRTLFQDEINSLTEDVNKVYKIVIPYFEQTVELSNLTTKYIEEYSEILECYKKLDKVIEQLYEEKTEIIGAESIISNIPNPEIRMKVYELIYLHNKAIYSKMTEEHNNLSANAATNYQHLLLEYGIQPEEYSINVLMKNSIEITETMLKELTKLNNITNDQIIKILEFGDIAGVKQLISLIQKEILTTEFALQYTDIYDSSSYWAKTLIENLTFIQVMNINPRYLINCQEIYFVESQLFKDNFRVLEDYKLIEGMRAGMQCAFLSYQNLSENIDTLLELGYEKNLEESLEILNYQDKFDRLKIMKMLNVPLTTTEEILEVLTTDKFMIPDSITSDYIYNAVEYNLPTTIEFTECQHENLPDLTPYSNTQRTYNFGGTIISKNKVHRNISGIIAKDPKECLLYSIINNSFLSDEEIVRIKEAIGYKNTDDNSKKKTN